MKKIIVMFLVINLVVPFSLFALNDASSCECGQHATAIYTFTIIGGSGVTCCNGTIYPQSSGFKNTYEQSGGAYMLKRSEPISGSAAQAACCNPS